MKTKIQMTLDNWDAELFLNAVRVASKGYREDEPDRKQREFVAKWALRSFCKAIIAAGGMPVPTAVQLQLRFECPEEMNGRVELESSYKAVAESKDIQLMPWLEQLRVVADGLDQRAEEVRCRMQTYQLPAALMTKSVQGNRWN